MVAARRFGDRLIIDIFHLPIVTGQMFDYLGMLDDASVYHVCARVDGQTSRELIQTLLRYWFTPFGTPDEIVVDAQRSFVSLEFGETLVKEFGIQVLPIAGEAHWQIGKAERHQWTVKVIATRLADQFPPTSAEDLDRLVVSATSAKNRLLNRGGSHPVQFVGGRIPKLPSALLSEPDAVPAHEHVTRSEIARENELIRVQGEINFLQYGWFPKFHRVFWDESFA